MGKRGKLVAIAIAVAVLAMGAIWWFCGFGAVSDADVKTVVSDMAGNNPEDFVSQTLTSGEGLSVSSCEVENRSGSVGKAGADCDVTLTNDLFDVTAKVHLTFSRQAGKWVCTDSSVTSSEVTAIGAPDNLQEGLDTSQVEQGIDLNYDQATVNFDENAQTCEVSIPIECQDWYAKGSGAATCELTFDGHEWTATPLSASGVTYNTSFKGKTFDSEGGTYSDSGSDSVTSSITFLGADNHEMHLKFEWSYLSGATFWTHFYGGDGTTVTDSATYSGSYSATSGTAFTLSRDSGQDSSLTPDSLQFTYNPESGTSAEISWSYGGATYTQSYVFKS
jgi:hypothetical protein